MKKRAYRSVGVQTVKIEEVQEELRMLSGVVGIDVSKDEYLVSLRYGDSSFERPWRAKSREELGALVWMLKQLHQVGPLPIGMESTGTYGDALRQALTDAGLDVRRVSSKAGSDYAEVFDGVSSQHDAKDAAVIAELVAIGKSRAWPWRAPSPADEELSYWVDWLDIHQGQELQWLGRLEALLARYWPEATEWLPLRSETLVRILLEYGGPGGVREDAQAQQRIARWGGPLLSAEKVEGLVQSARDTVGVRMTSLAVEQLQKYAGQVRLARQEQKTADAALTRLAAKNAVLSAQATVVGVNTACVLWTALGDVREYDSGGAYRKAMGLNLKERSSGKYQGQLKISKRGPGRVRRWLYFAALRKCQDPAVKPWYASKKHRENDKGGKALVAIMRKLALALYQVGARGAKYESRKLFPGAPSKSRPAVPAASG
jgi:transposase